MLGEPTPDMVHAVRAASTTVQAGIVLGGGDTLGKGEETQKPWLAGWNVARGTKRVKLVGRFALRDNCACENDMETARRGTGTGVRGGGQQDGYNQRLASGCYSRMGRHTTYDALRTARLESRRRSRCSRELNCG